MINDDAYKMKKGKHEYMNPIEDMSSEWTAVITIKRNSSAKCFMVIKGLLPALYK